MIKRDSLFPKPKACLNRGAQAAAAGPRAFTMARRAFARALLAAGLAAPMLCAAAYPERPVRLIVSYPAGGSTDLIARALANAMSRTLGQQIVVENRPGAGGVVGSSAAASAAPDGYTVLVSGGTQALMKDLHPTLPFDPAVAFDPVAMLVEIPNVLAVSGTSPYQSLQSVIDAARQAPGKLAYASAGPGTPANLVCERLKVEADVDILHVPYKGNAPAVNDVLGGQVPMMCNNLAGTLPYADGGRLRLLAVTGKQRSPYAPDVPTFGELGLERLDTSVWMSLVVPKGTPAEAIQRLNEAAARALDDPGVRTQLEQFGAVPIDTGVQNYAALQGRERELWGDMVRSLGLAGTAK
ncbi:tripartite tricarboxylate transporter substrate binding protein [Verticiella sediminum]|uniref:Tripartite tricarboxylate transporter substrate binding protein n=1 Tax=Verticiella sediminum TaxID=1247510 RepID=A0A556A7S2_9BURK|nr:tripartite tricarboxylate transporter substrate-binding protein [Verticiella sediminum]TSH88923.1 tripartite tricarboxylate transporter substrate binding protein [Verticiella sediminum]